MQGILFVGKGERERAWFVVTQFFWTLHSLSGRPQSWSCCRWPLPASSPTAEFTFCHPELWISCNNYLELLTADLTFLNYFFHCQKWLFQGRTYILWLFTDFLRLQPFCFIFGVYGSSVWDGFYVSSKESTQHIKQVFLATVQISDMRFVGNCFLCCLADFGLTSV